MSTAIEQLTELSADEVVTHSYVRDVPLPSGGVLALVTLDNGRDHTRPSTLGPASLHEFGATLDAVRTRASSGEIAAIAVTGKPYFLAAGADLSKVSAIPSRDVARELARLGHAVLGKLHDAGVPTFVFVNGLALGGGLEIGLHADYRTVDSSAAAIALPEVFLGIIPGWGGAWLLPNLVSGSIIVAIVLNLPTAGPMLLQSLMSQDMYLAGAFVLLICVLTLLGSLLSDILLALADPRIRLE